jgi:hypothetical protein
MQLVYLLKKGRLCKKVHLMEVASKWGHLAPTLHPATTLEKEKKRVLYF